MQTALFDVQVKGSAAALLRCSTDASLHSAMQLQLKGKNPHQYDNTTGGQNMWTYQSGDISPRNAEMRADLGKAADLWNMQVGVL
jgi:hypothetical protein